MKKKHENTIFPSSPGILFFIPVYKIFLAEYQNAILFSLITSCTSQAQRASSAENMLISEAYAHQHLRLP
jgi:hypothetical protein